MTRAKKLPEYNPNISSLVWAMKKARYDYYGRSTVAYVIYPLLSVLSLLLTAIELPRSHTAFWTRVLFGVGGVAFAYVALSSLLVTFALLVAPYQQRNALRSNVNSDDGEIAKLKSQIGSERVGETHANELREILKHVRPFVVGRRPIVFKNARDKDAIVGHFPELGPHIEEWDGGAMTRLMSDERVNTRFDSEVASLELRPPTFVSASVKYLREVVKWKAFNGLLEDDLPIEWYPRDDEHPEILALKDGQTIAITDESNLSLTRDACERRLQVFVDTMRKWPEMVIFGNAIHVSSLKESQSKLLKDLDLRIEQHGYLRGAGCPRCPQL
ncbi:MAG: hypothetical protein ACHQFZ_10690 [Acidimicrobiales bacterium]